ncbi:rrp15-like protein [Holotrichia oblita]|uniref:Rrp15-like protein n=1 Tax=Holotrichia oblita TaxID=644536 RepID=A0ACB9TQN0_HOLOL|nr:rrp15-like protein [Holotrichia oblita]
MTVNLLEEEMEKEDANISNNSDSDDSEQDQDTDDNAQNENAQWADSIAKILKTNKPKGKKTLVLSKGKKLTGTVKKKPQKLEFEVEATDGEIKRDVVIEEDENKEESEVQERRKRKDLPILRKKPNILHKDRERTLSKIATRGVVQLFNAIKSQQIDTNTKLDEAGPMEVKRNRVLKNVNKKAFLDMLMQEKSGNVDDKEVGDGNEGEVNRRRKRGMFYGMIL